MNSETLEMDLALALSLHIPYIPYPTTSPTIILSQLGALPFYQHIHRIYASNIGTKKKQRRPVSMISVCTHCGVFSSTDSGAFQFAVSRPEDLRHSPLKIRSATSGA